MFAGNALWVCLARRKSLEPHFLRDVANAEFLYYHIR